MGYPAFQGSEVLSRIFIFDGPLNCERPDLFQEIRLAPKIYCYSNGQIYVPFDYQGSQGTASGWHDAVNGNTFFKRLLTGNQDN